MELSHKQNKIEIRYMILFIVAYIFSLKFFQATPFEKIFFNIQVLYLLTLSMFLLTYIITVLLKSERINKIILYYFLIVIILPIYTAFRSYSEFAQPLIYGYLSERAWFLVITGVWIYYLIKLDKISLNTLKSSFLFMAWFSLISFILFMNIFDPSQLADSEEFSRLVKDTASRGIRYKFQMYFIVFGALYYFIAYVDKRKFKNLIFFTLFFGYLLFIYQSRTTLMFLSSTFILYLWFRYSLSKFTVHIIKIILFLLFSLLIVNYLKPDFVQQLIYLFEQMFTVLTGDISEEASSNARIFASMIVLDYFDNNINSLLFGIGSISNRWGDGYRTIFGYFYPADIGMLGGIFVYGILGMILVHIIPVLISIKVIKKQVSEDIFLITIKYLLIYEILRSIQGWYYFKFMEYIIPLFILLAYQAKNNKYIFKGG